MARTDLFESETIRIKIDGVWSVPDFEEFFRSITSIAKAATDELDYYFSGEVGQVYLDRDIRREHGVLRVVKIVFASPGFTDLTGIAGIVRELRGLIEFLVTNFQQRGDRENNREMARLNLAQRKVELIRELASMPENERDRVREHILRTSACDPLLLAISEGRVRGAERHQEEWDVGAPK